MAEIAIIFYILRKNPGPSTVKALHSSGYFAAKAAASAAAASVAAGAPYAYYELLGNFSTPVVYCDAGPAWSEDYVSSSPSASQRIFEYGFLNNYNTKQYKVELKPLFSAFEWRALAVTIFKSFVAFLVLHPHEPCSSSKDDDDDDLPLDNEEEEQHVADYIVPLKKSVEQILRDTTVVTTRRILERISVHYVSKRMACKLLKDVPKSTMRKSGRRLPTVVFLFSVSKTTFRVLGLAATWLIEVGIGIYRFVSRMIRSRGEDDDDIDLREQLILLGKKVSGTSIWCGASLVFWFTGAGIGATLIRPSMGQHIGCVVGESVGPAIVSNCLGKFSHAEL